MRRAFAALLGMAAVSLPAVVLALSPVTLLTTAKTAVVRDRPDADGDLAIFRVGRDPALAAPVNPLCPATSAIQLGAYPQATNRVVAQPVGAAAALPCEHWSAIRGGYRYRDPSGATLGVRKIVYTKSRLLIRVEGGNFVATPGPVGYLQAWLTIGDTRYLVRYHNFARNEATRMATRRTSGPAGKGEALFWQTLWGDAHRDDEALRHLGKAVRLDRRDGRSHFLIAMLHLYRFGQAVTDYRSVDDAAKAEAQAAQASFTRAVPLLWDAERQVGDNRVPGFAAANTFLTGVLLDDAALRAKGLADLDAVVALNPLFNSFDLIGVVPQFYPPDNPLYTDKVLPALDAALSDPTCIATQPELCGNDGMAPRNAAGALTLFGDLYAKGGRPAGADPQSDVEKAEGWYLLAQALSPGWRFQPEIAARVGQAAARRDSYRDGDPANDAAIIGVGPQACAYCHNR